MTVNEYQTLAMRTLNPELSQKDVLINSVMGLCGESGEAIDIVKKWLAQGHALDKERLAKELGDIAWYLAEAATALDLPLEQIFQGNIDKLKRRFPEGFATEKSIDRADEKSNSVRRTTMRKNFGSKPAMYPMPVLIVAAYGEDGTANAMTAAWGGIVDTNLLGICLSAGHKTTQNIFAKGCYTVSMATADYVTEADYLGIVSGNQEGNKLAKAGLHTTKSTFVDAPLIDELPMALECKMVSYDKATGYLIGEIVNVSAEESILNEAGKVDPAKLKPITFDTINNQYLALGEKVGNAYQEGKKLK